MVSMTHKMTLGLYKKKIIQILGTSLPPKQKNKLTVFPVTPTKHVEIVFDKTIDNIKYFNQNYVTP